MWLNITVACCYGGDHYKGISMQEGVGFDMVPNCSGGTALQFKDCVEQNLPSVNVGAISSIVLEETPCEQYLKLTAVVA
jgi:hypothetical protein